MRRCLAAGATIARTAVAFVVVVSPAWGWNDMGHMVVARLAFDALTPAERLWALDVISQHPRLQQDFERLRPQRLPSAERPAWTFAHAATWPDLIRRFEHEPAAARDALVATYHRGRWHYVNLALEVDARGRFQERIPDLPSAPADFGSAGNILGALDVLIARFGTLSAAEQAVAICWLLHLVGDLHQPLHTTTLVAPGTLAGGDRGGNEITVSHPRVPARNLHALWDAAVGRGRDWARLDALVAGLGPITVTQEPVAFGRWALANRELAAASVYSEEVRSGVAAQSARGRAPRVIPSRRYLDAMRNHARGRVALAAQRTVLVLLELRAGSAQPVTRAAR